MGLTDIWRLYLFLSLGWTILSHCHNTHSRIDFLISNLMVNNVIDYKIGPIALTDHAIVELHVVLNSENVKKGRFRQH